MEFVSVFSSVSGGSVFYESKFVYMDGIVNIDNGLNSKSVGDGSEESCCIM